MTHAQTDTIYPIMGFDNRTMDEAIVVGFALIPFFQDETKHFCGMFFDYDDVFTIEAWVRVSEKSPETAGRGIIFGDQDTNGNGYRFGVRHNSGDNKWYLEMIMRDTTGSEQTQFYGWGTRYDYSETAWYHVAVVYDGNTTDTIALYVNGSSISVNENLDTSGISAPDFVTAN